MKKLFTTYNISVCGVLAGVMLVLASFSYFLGDLIGKSVFQISDIVYLSMFVTNINPIVLIFSAMVSGSLTDLMFGGLIYIPFTIFIKILIGVTMYFLNKKLKIYFSIIVSYSYVFLYVLYVYILYDQSTTIVEAITDSIQYSATVVLSLFIVSYKDFKKIYNNKKQKREIEVYKDFN
ncbi:hypothetical protein [Spiroplasma tabanidicola]|uniref:Class II fructose-1 n=1 Tax=Spiroplasma tabanidicola TaxID=324079 RepID=A0A6I6C7Z5_9MOLU|nr:hypothetical protein [Spiroplasma tabanidicola]QGS51886.1 class II fructose-1 [Spiroplasma tabanidicola]